MFLNRGVQHTTTAPTQSPGGIPGTVLDFVEAKTYAVRYVDTNGRDVTTMVHRIGGVWHLAPNGENYAASLRSLTRDSKLSKGLEERFISETTTGSIPKEDAVDIDAGG